MSGVVQSVNADDAVAMVAPDDADEGFTLPVMLRSTVSGLKGIVVLPKVGSEVTFVLVDEAQFVLINTSELDKVKIDVPELELSCDKVVINGGDNGEMVKIKQLENNLDQLKKYCENLKTAITSGLNGVGAGTAASGAAGAQAFSLNFAGNSIVFKDMKDKKVTH